MKITRLLVLTLVLPGAASPRLRLSSGSGATIPRR
jgi:hypothetical protein